MPETVQREKRRGRRGLLVIGLLAIIFFTLLALLLTAGEGTPQHAPTRVAEELYAIPARVRLRTEPSVKSPVVTSVQRGERLSVMYDRGAWVRVRSASGAEGWAERASLERVSEHERRLVRSAAIRKLPPLPATVRTRVAVYSGPGPFYPIVGELMEGSRVLVHTRDHDFYAVDLAGEIAYAEVDAIDIADSGLPRLEVAETATGTSSESGREPPPEEAPVARREEQRRHEPEMPLSGIFAAVPPGGTQPQVIRRIPPEYPPDALRAGVEGPVLIRAVVRRDGTVDNPEVLRDLPYGLGDAARAAVARWRFRPATYRGEPIDVYYTVTVNYRLSAR